MGREEQQPDQHEHANLQLCCLWEEMHRQICKEVMNRQISGR